MTYTLERGAICRDGQRLGLITRAAYGEGYLPAAIMDQFEREVLAALNGPKTPTEHLSAAYVAWLDAEGLEHASADELLAGAGLTQPQRQWLSAFWTVWDGVQAMEDSAHVV